jgi:putative flippase GtrA
MGATVRKQVIRFLVVGFTTVAIDYLSYRLLIPLGMGYAPAKAASFIIGTVFAYFANRFWTFGGQESHPAPGSVLRFGVLYATTLLCNVAANALLLAVLAGHAFAIQSAFVVATAISATLNFLGMKYLVFRPQLPSPQRS